ncbi:MAG: hypothetical protein WCF67_01770 [Chitinophagaceae bacterium]
MRNILFFVILAVALAAQFIPVWWIIAPVAFVASLFLGKTPKQAFWSAFAANALVWTVFILITATPANPLLYERLSNLFSLPHWSLLVIIAVLIAGLISGLAALSGQYIRQLINK